MRQLRNDIGREWDTVGKSKPLDVILRADTNALRSQIQSDLNSKTFTIQVQGVVNSQMIPGGGRGGGGMGGEGGLPHAGPTWITRVPDIQASYGRNQYATGSTAAGNAVVWNGSSEKMSQERRALRDRFNTPVSAAELAQSRAVERQSFLYGSPSNQGVFPMLEQRRRERAQYRQETSPTIRSGQQMTIPF